MFSTLNSSFAHSNHLFLLGKLSLLPASRQKHTKPHRFGNAPPKSISPLLVFSSVENLGTAVSNRRPCCGTGSGLSGSASITGSGSGSVGSTNAVLSSSAGIFAFWTCVFRGKLRRFLGTQKYTNVNLNTSLIVPAGWFEGVRNKLYRKFFIGVDIARKLLGIKRSRAKDLS